MSNTDDVSETTQKTLFGDRVEEDPAPETNEDYKFSRPQCTALTADGDRCSNSVRRTEGEAELCAQHYGMDELERVEVDHDG